MLAGLLIRCIAPAEPLWAALFTRLREHLDSLVVRMDFEQGEELMSADTYHIIPGGVAVRGIEEAAGIPPSAQGSLRSAFTRRKITQGTGRSHGLRSASAGRKIPHPAEVRRVSG
jgi:hypothetical protein